MRQIWLSLGLTGLTGLHFSMSLLWLSMAGVSALASTVAFTPVLLIGVNILALFWLAYYVLLMGCGWQMSWAGVMTLAWLLLLSFVPT
jgi:hypothetical protein